jgi:bacteriocin biosynthesis cyclodehydratase domain-containing protein
MWTVSPSVARGRHHIGMILRLDPRLPLVWRSPVSIQLGIDPPVVVLDDVTDTQERLLAALAVGVSEPGTAMIAHGRLDERDDLLRRLGPALVPPAPDGPVATIAVSGDPGLTEPIARALAASGVHVVTAPTASELAESGADLAVLASHYVLPPEVHGLWLRRDVPHLPVVLSDTAIAIGPMVEPGTGPCLLCVELHRRDANAAWPAIATQLLGRRSCAGSPALVLEAAAAVCRSVLDRIAAGARAAAASTRIDAATGERTSQLWQPHPECGCRGIGRLVEPLSPGRPGSGWADAARHAPAHERTTTAQDAVAPA